MDAIFGFGTKELCKKKVSLSLLHDLRCFVDLCYIKLLNITHDRKRIFKFPHTVLQSFMSATRLLLSHCEKVLLLNLELAEVQTGQTFDRIF